MAININTIITNTQSVYPANNNQIWTILKQDNPSLTDEIINQLELEFTSKKITITTNPSSTEYEGSIEINSYQYNLYVQIDGSDYYVYNFNEFCSNSGYFQVETQEGYKTFRKNSEFTSLEFIENPTISFIGNSFLRTCTSFNQPLTLPEGITSIGNGFLVECYSFNQPLTLPNSLTSIGNNFLASGLDTKSMSFNQPLTLPNSLTSIGTYFLYNCGRFNQPLTLPNSLTSIGNNFLDKCTSFNQPLTLPNSLSLIGNNFLHNCTSFNQPLTLPNSLTSIGTYFLYNCGRFNQPLTLPNSLTSIGDSFLRSCTSFNRTLTLPNSLTSIGTFFMNCCDNFNQKLTISNSITPEMFLSNNNSFATTNSSATVYTNGFKIKYDKFDQLLARFPNSTTNPYRNIVIAQTTFIAKETSLSYKYHLNFVLGENDIKVYLVKENEVTMKFDKPITTILPDTSTGKLLIGNALKNLPVDQLTENAIETKITAINFYNK